LRLRSRKPADLFAFDGKTIGLDWELDPGQRKTAARILPKASFRNIGGFAVHHQEAMRSRSIPGEYQYTVSFSFTGNKIHVGLSPLERKQPVK
jgi:hypothetical protein